MQVLAVLMCETSAATPGAPWHDQRLRRSVRSTHANVEERQAVDQGLLLEEQREGLTNAACERSARPRMRPDGPPAPSTATCPPSADIPGQHPERAAA